jgi:hypothetical protein
VQAIGVPWRDCQQAIVASIAWTRVTRRALRLLSRRSDLFHDPGSMPSESQMKEGLARVLAVNVPLPVLERLLEDWIARGGGHLDH